MTITELVKLAHENAKAKGFWDGPQPPCVGEKLMLVVTELSEALEEVRQGHALCSVYEDEPGRPEGFSIELADAVIRIADLCGYFGINLEKVIKMKHEYNLTRPHKHGKAF